MSNTINLGSVTPEEFNIVMKQLAAGQLGECLDLFMRFRQLGVQFQQEQAQAQQDSKVLPPPAA